MRIFIQLGKPKSVKTDRDGAFSSLALKRWLDEEKIELQFNKAKNRVSDVERLHKTINMMMKN